MAVKATEFEQLMGDIREGDPEAIRTMVERYDKHLRWVIHRLLDRHPRLRSLFDPQDFTQAVWASFFLFLKQHEFIRRQDLISFLDQLAHNKVVETVRQRLYSRKYNLRRECSLHELTPAEVERLIDPAPAAAAAEAEAADEWRQLLRGQPTVYRQALLLLSEGQTHLQVAEALGLNEKTIDRLIHRLAHKRDVDAQ